MDFVNKAARQDWLLKKGIGEIEGKEGPPGPRGPSDYEVWLSQGNTGSYADFEKTRKGADGKDGKDGEPGPAGKNGTNGRDGTNGTDGINGKDGKDGRPGASMTAGGFVDTPADLPDPATTDPSLVWFTGPEGEEHFHIILDGAWRDMGRWAGEPGADGKDGKNGADGKNGTDGKDGTIADQISSDWNSIESPSRILNKPEVISDMRIKWNNLQIQDDKGEWSNKLEIEDFYHIDTLPSNRLLLEGQGLLVRPPFPLNGNIGDVLTYQTGNPLDFERIRVREDGLSMRDIATNDSIVIIVGRTGYVSYSYDTINWIGGEDAVFEGEDLNSIIWANGQFIIATNAGDLFTSTDGLSWELKGSIGKRISAMAYSKGKVVATTGSELYISYDYGRNFTKVNAPTDIMGNDVAVIKGKWYVTLRNGRIASTYDFESWDIVQTPNTGFLYWITYGHGKFLAVGNNVILYSLDGVEWIDATPEGVDGTFHRCFVTRNYFIASGQAGGTNSGIWFSEDAIHWQPLGKGSGRPIQFSGAATIGGVLCFADSVYVCRSIDGMGTTWKSRETIFNEVMNEKLQGLPSNPSVSQLVAALKG